MLERGDQLWRKFAVVEGGIFLGLQALEVTGVLTAGAAGTVGTVAIAGGVAFAGGYAAGSALSCQIECRVGR